MPALPPTRAPFSSPCDGFMSRSVSAGCQCHNSLPTPRTALRALVALLVWQRRCQHQAFADLEALVESGRGDVPLSHLKFRCPSRSSDRADFVVTSRDNPQPW